MRLKNISLDKEFVKGMEDGFYIMHVSLENTLKLMEHFYPEMHISWEKVHPDQKMLDGNSIPNNNEFDVYPLLGFYSSCLGCSYLLKLQ